jgi:hypothetical protein
MRDAAAKGKEIDTPFNNNLPRPPNDVMVNPGNPDSNHWLLRVEFPSTAGCPMYFRGSGMKSVKMYVGKMERA